MKISTAILVCSLVSVTPALVLGTPTTIAQWTFENPPLPASAGLYSPAVGSGSASGSHVGAAAYSNPAGNGSANSYSSTVWAVGDYWQFSVSTLGFESISISWDQAGSGTGPSDFILQYSTDGTTFTKVGSDYSVSLVNWSTTTSHSGFTFNPDLSGIASMIADQSGVYFRLVDNSTTAIGGGSVGTGGTDRIDNFTVTGAQIPDSTSGLVCLGCSLGLLAVLRRMSPVSSPLPLGTA
jgi:hypothetical protein